jgi:hypothetical protein
MELVDTPHVSEFTKKTLAQFGWKEGDAIPADLGAFLVKLRETLPASPRNDVLVDVATMPPDAVAQATEMLAAAKAYVAEGAKGKAAAAAVAALNPAAQALYMATLEETAAPQIIDDREEASAPTPPQPPPAVTPAPVPADTDTADSAGAGPMLVLPFCPRCGWDMRQKFDITPTDLDKEDFVAAVLGNTRFKRDYKLMGGKLIVAFKTILAEENKMIHRQLVLDQAAKKIVTEAEWFVQMLEYRMALSLDYITNGNGKPTAVAPPLETFPAGKDESQLVALTEHVNSHYLAHEVTRRLVGTHLRQFQRLVEALEAMAIEPSFWNGID